jgi:hypothetical protein
MPIRFRCRNCQQLLGIARRKAGQSVRCPTCHRDVLVPPEDEEPPPGAAAPPGEPAPVAAAPPAAPAAGAPPLYERSDFDALLHGETDLPSRLEERRPVLPRALPPLAPAPDPIPVLAPVRHGGTLRQPAGGFDVEPAEPPAEPAWPLPVPPPPGLVLSSQQVTWLAIAAVVLLAVSFAAGVLVGRFVL